MLYKFIWACILRLNLMVSELQIQRALLPHQTLFKAALIGAQALQSSSLNTREVFQQPHRHLQHCPVSTPHPWPAISSHSELPSAFTHRYNQYLFLAQAIQALSLRVLFALATRLAHIGSPISSTRIPQILTISNKCSTLLRLLENAHGYQHSWHK